MTLGDRVVVMKDGWIMQVGTPLDIYRHPVNRFVAGFLGTPPMNFIDGTLVQEGSQVWFDEGGFRIAVPAWAKDDLAGKIGSPVVMGIRPETLSEKPLNGQVDNALAVTVNVVETLGDKMDVYLTAGSHDHIVARVDARLETQPNTTETMYIDLDRVHFFDPDAADGASGANLCLETEKARV